MLYRLIYTSDQVQTFTEDELNLLLDKARRNNAAVQLSGLLIFHQGRFFQTLEGPKDNLEMVFRKIAQDRRHNGLSIVAKGVANERAFPNWRMGFSHPTALSPALRGTVFSLYDLVPPNSEDRSEDPVVREKVREFLGSFRRLSA